MKTVECEGCHEFHPSWRVWDHRKGCPAYLTWSRDQPHQCPCGMGFAAERSLRSHKKGCSQAVSVPVGRRRCVCGALVVSFAQHRPQCPGPANVSDVVLTHPHPPDDHTCVCGKRYDVQSSLPEHQDGCSQWYVYRRQYLTVLCEGCDLGFRDVYSKRVHAQVCVPWQSWREEQDRLEKTYPCPSCGDLMRGPQLGLHVNSCLGPWTRTDWELWRRQGHSGRDGVALRDDIALTERAVYIICHLCDLRFKQMSTHLTAVHGIEAWEYRARTGGPTMSHGTSARTSSTMMLTYGVRHALQHPIIGPAAEEKRKATNRERYGSDSPFSAGLIVPPRKNRLERVVEILAPTNVVYTGDHSYWVRCQGADGRWKNRNPDFVVYTDPSALERVRSGTPANEIRTYKVIEVLGDYFHGEGLRGMDGPTYAASRIAEYATVGIHCLVLWESEVKADPEGVRARLAGFVG